MRESPRVRRLRTDLKALTQMQADSTILDFTALGDPPEVYTVRFHGKGLFRNPGSPQAQVRDLHEVKIELGASYPRLMPELAWLTPIFHPNISGAGAVCLGGYGTYWVPSLNLDELCEMLWDMIRYQNYDTESPYNRDAANWAKAQRVYRLPIDGRPIRDKLAKNAHKAAVVKSMLPPQAGPMAAIPVEDDAEIAEVIFIDDDDVVDAEVVGPEDPDVLIIE